MRYARTSTDRFIIASRVLSMDNDGEFIFYFTTKSFYFFALDRILMNITWQIYS